jgi:hypothetical protein
MARLRQIYPNLLGIQPGAAAATPDGDIEEIRPRDLDPDQLFRSFFQDVQGRPMDAEETALFVEVSRRILAGEVQP